jgi:hypothetical protein
MAELLRYKFYDIFDYDAHNRLLTPKFTVIVDSSIYFKGEAITQRLVAHRFNLFEYLGHDFAAEWNKKTEQLHIRGLC